MKETIAVTIAMAESIGNPPPTAFDPTSGSSAFPFGKVSFIRIGWRGKTNLADRKIEVPVFELVNVENIPYLQ